MRATTRPADDDRLDVEVAGAWSRSGSRDVGALAARLGVAVVDGDPPGGGPCALRLRRDGSVVLSVRRGSSQVARRWAAAWGVAHAIANRDLLAAGPVEADRTYRTRLGEVADRAANLHAASLLMPWREVAGDPAFLAGDVDGLASTFGVGRGVAAMRLAELRPALGGGSGRAASGR